MFAIYSWVYILFDCSAFKAWLSVMLTPFAIGSLFAVTAHAHMRGMYASQAEAQQRAAELKCKGTFTMGGMWMPCANERALHDALQKAQ